MKKIGKTMIALALAGAMFASQSGVASAKEGTLFAISTGKGYMAGTYTVGRKIDTVNGIVRISNLIYYNKASWTASAANDGKHAQYSFGSGVSGKSKTKYRAKTPFRDNSIKKYQLNGVDKASIIFYW